jgi:hypothetical protein
VTIGLIEIALTVPNAASMKFNVKLTCSSQSRLKGAYINLRTDEDLPHTPASSTTKSLTEQVLEINTAASTERKSPKSFRASKRIPT